jgi:hypothetical protein
MDLEFKLRFSESELKEYDERYDYDRSRVDISAANRLNKYYDICPAQGCLTYEQFIDMVKWKSSRRLAAAKANPPELVEELTRIAFSANHQAARMGALTLLSGVGLPVASVLMHFGCDRTVPIIDERALWSLSCEKPKSYTLEFWEAYLHYCRRLAERNNMSVRSIDRALWKYSEVHQGGLSASQIARSRRAKEEDFRNSTGIERDRK